MISYLYEIREHLIKNLGKNVVCIIDYARCYTLDRKDGILILDYEDSYNIEHFSINDANGINVFPFCITEEISGLTYVENTLVVIFRFNEE